MSLRSRTAILAISAGLLAAPTAHAAQIANGLTSNGLSWNGLVSNGLVSNGRSVQAQAQRGSHNTTRLKAVILRDGSKIDLQ